MIFRGVLSLSEASYPAWLREIYDPPNELHCWGNLEQFLKPCVAVVGTRRSSAYGEKIAFEWSRAFSQNGFCVVSGLAFGIDAAAHSGALEGPGGTIAVIAQGLDELRPQKHRFLAKSIVEAGGLVISEKKGGEPYFDSDYLVRNRLISGLSKGVVVVEAPYKSGALNTASQANEQGREVMVVPGRLGEEMCAGSLSLVRSGAHLVCSPQEVAEILDWKFEKTPQKSLCGLPRGLYEMLQKDPRSSPELAEQYEGSLKEFYSALAELELKGLVGRLRDGRYFAL